MTRRWLVAGLAGLAAAAWAQGGARLVIETPAAGAFVTDRTPIAARIEPQPPEGGAEFVFFADGREVCALRTRGRAVCDWDAGAVLREHQIRVVARLPGGGRLTATRRTRAVDVAAATSVRVVQVTAVVTDRAGKFVSGLPRESFRILEDGVPQTIEHFSDAGSSLDLVLALDYSASMTGFVDDLRAAVLQFLVALPPTARVTMLAFNDEVFTLARPSDGPDRGMLAMEELQPAGGTALNDVILKAFGDLSRGIGRRTLVAFTDGEDRTSRATLAQTRRAIEASDVTLYFVALGRGREARDLQKTMEELSDLSGGRTLLAGGPEELGARFKDVVDELAHQYLLGYQPKNGALDGTWRRIEVRVAGERLRVRARPGYRADPQ